MTKFEEDMYLWMKSNDTNMINLQNSINALNNNLSVFTATIGQPSTPGVILASALTFPYTLPNLVYKSVSIIVPVGETIKYNGAILNAGSYNYEAANIGGKLESFILSEPSGTGVIIVTMD